MFDINVFYNDFRKLLLCRVNLGKHKILQVSERLPHAPPGYNSVLATPTPEGLDYPEYIVYRGEQVTN